MKGDTRNLNYGSYADRWLIEKAQLAVDWPCPYLEVYELPRIPRNILYSNPLYKPLYNPFKGVYWSSYVFGCSA